MWVLEYVATDGYLGMEMGHRFKIEMVSKDDVVSAAKIALEYVEKLKMMGTKCYSFVLSWREIAKEDIDQFITALKDRQK